jgi:uncharacterized protein
LNNLTRVICAHPRALRGAYFAIQRCRSTRSPVSGKQQRLPALAFGIERLGLVSLRFPLAVALVTILLAIAAGVGIFKLNVDDSLSELFRSDTAEFRQYEDVTTRFPSTEFDVLLVIEGEDLLPRESIEKLRGLAENLQLIGGTRGLISLFSARRPPGRRETPAPLFPDELPEGAAYQKLVDRVMKNEILRGKLLSEDGQLTLMVLALEPSAAKSNHLRDVLGQIRKTAKEDLAGRSV